MVCRWMALTRLSVYIFIRSFFFSGIWSGVFFVSAQVCNSRNWNCRSNSFVRAERDKREVAKISHVEEELRRFWLYLNVCSAWMIYKNWHHFLAVVATVLNVAVAYSQAFVLLDVCRA